MRRLLEHFRCVFLVSSFPQTFLKDGIAPDNNNKKHNSYILAPRKSLLFQTPCISSSNQFTGSRIKVPNKNPS